MSGALKTLIPNTTAHLCVDMQRMFVEDTAWRTPWAGRVLPRISALCRHRPDCNWFTRFVPAPRAGHGEGTWRAYWERWPSMTLDVLGADMVDLARELQIFVPPGQLIDKTVYSPWLGTRLHADLQAARIDTLIISGAETDVCVLATVMGAVDLGYRIIVATDAVCSSADHTHDRLLVLYNDRFAQQIETADCADIMQAWR